MRRFKGVIFGALAMTVLMPSIAEAQSSPRIVMRRPLNPSATTGDVTPACGTEGQPACPSECDFVGAAWDVGQWQGDACGQGGTVSRSVQCMAIKTNGQRIPREDSFCLQDASAFHQNCNAPSNNLPM